MTLFWWTDSLPFLHLSYYILWISQTRSWDFSFTVSRVRRSKNCVWRSFQLLQHMISRKVYDFLYTIKRVDNAFGIIIQPWKWVQVVVSPIRRMQFELRMWLLIRWPWLFVFVPQRKQRGMSLVSSLSYMLAFPQSRQQKAMSTRSLVIFLKLPRRPTAAVEVK